MLTERRVLITGGTGSLGKTLVKRILTGELGRPEKITVFSRDEAKQHDMRNELSERHAATDEVVFDDYKNLIDFRIGDIRDYESVCSAIRRCDVIFNAAAMKQVPTCEYVPGEAVLTNVMGANNIVRAISNLNLKVEIVVGISTDKACKPVNVMGMTKSIQERIFITGNLECKNTRFVNVRYGNVLASRGSVIPFFHQQILKGRAVTVTSREMTRFLLNLNSAVDVIIEAVQSGRPGETIIPIVPSARMIDLAEALIGDRKNPIEITGVRPGEKIHEILISEEEAHRTYRRNEYYAIKPMLPDLTSNPEVLLNDISKEYSSADSPMSKDQLVKLLTENCLLVDQSRPPELEMLQ
ncbi:polysaccharide biosynthesis protein [Rubinisphaera italica]|uniref:UDP-N-acetylglucosamine 4,6-dehydratase (Inverting) n=1 Tax=Rubinisphaera italica TaxID=2527969 RepID=A0A5C5XCC3_9PLAN|nr:polysaccharide biosynthesis protein [Rubinisphaera italica]TWT60438.1 UDP-N-acetylglucosamine 4,6-dehydratase (inverting) [Rubinisphaera italica]